MTVLRLIRFSDGRLLPSAFYILKYIKIFLRRHFVVIFAIKCYNIKRVFMNSRIFRRIDSEGQQER